MLFRSERLTDVKCEPASSGSRLGGIARGALALFFLAAVILFLAARLSVNTLDVGHLSVDYPAGLAEAREVDKERMTSDSGSYTRITSRIVSPDHEASVSVWELQGTSYEAMVGFAEHAREASLVAATETESKLGMPGSYWANKHYDPPEYLTIDGREALMLRSSFTNPDGVVLHEILYAVKTSDDSHGLIGASYTDAEYEENKAFYAGVWEGINARIRISD